MLQVTAAAEASVEVEAFQKLTIEDLFVRATDAGKGFAGSGPLPVVAAKTAGPEG